MNRLLALIAAGCACFGQSALPDNVIHLARVREKVRAVLNSLPDYVCLATTERFSSPKPSREPMPVDVVRLEVAHIGTKELYSWPGADAFDERGFEEIVQHGLLTSGAFAAHARDVFTGGFANIKFEGQDEILGRPALRWSFDIAPYASAFTLTFARTSASVGSAGRFWADAKTNDLLRLEVRATEVPPGFPITSVTRTIDYGKSRLGNREVWFPQTAEDIVEHSDRITNVNRTEFSHCRQYGAASTLSFESPPPGSQTAAPRARPILLPAGLIVKMELENAISSDGSVTGDPITARVAAGIRGKAGLLIPKGALVHGRLRLLSHQRKPVEAYQVGLEFTQIDLPDGAARFYATLKSVDIEVPGLNWMLSTKTTSTIQMLGNKDRVETNRSEIVYRNDIPGVGNFFIEGGRCTLPKGMVMTWVTEDITRRK